MKYAVSKNVWKFMWKGTKSTASLLYWFSFVNCFRSTPMIPAEHTKTFYTLLTPSCNIFLDCPLHLSPSVTRKNSLSSAFSSRFNTDPLIIDRPNDCKRQNEICNTSNHRNISSLHAVLLAVATAEWLMTLYNLRSSSRSHSCWCRCCSLLSCSV